jgi:hypothetical protein
LTWQVTLKIHILEVSFSAGTCRYPAWSAYCSPKSPQADSGMLCSIGNKHFFLIISKATRGLEPISYRGALLSTLLHAITYRGALLSTLLHAISYRRALLSTLLHAISYRGALLSTLLHANVYVFTQFVECTGADCKSNHLSAILPFCAVQSRYWWCHKVLHKRDTRRHILEDSNLVVIMYDHWFSGITE